MSASDELDKFIKKVEKALKDLGSKEELEKLLAPMAERIRVRTRLGYGVSETNGSRERLEDTADSTKRAKQYKKNSGRLSNETTPKRSNLTDSGQLLNSLKAKGIKNGEARIEPTGQRNKDVARYVTEGNRFTPKRPFLDLSKPEVRALVEEFRQALLSKISKL